MTDAEEVRNNFCDSVSYYYDDFFARGTKIQLRRNLNEGLFLFLISAIL